MENDNISVIKVRDVLMVTVPPDPDDTAMAFLQEKVLMSMEQFRAKGVVLDISAVETLDSYFARVLSETVQMVILMGGKTVIAGMRPSVAITTTQLGLSIGNAETALNVDRALDMISESLQWR
ncbi:MAG TPA: STAS domain-containing protein [Negativicutes bacterium]|nr:STAS domain-containing protein [Negativicutes bacterium]